MRDKYWAKKQYGNLDASLYEKERFNFPSGKLMGEIEKQSILMLLTNNNSYGKTRKLQILDVATGTGRLAFYIENYYKKSIITGIDINENMLKEAKKNSKRNRSKVKFIKGDLYNLPFKKASFDVVVGLRFSMHLPDLNRVLSEFSRVIKKDGVLIFDIFNLNSILWFRQFFQMKKAEELGYFSLKRIMSIAEKNGLRFENIKGIWFLGETITKIIPSSFLIFFIPILIKPPFFLEKYSEKIILCFKKI